MQSAPRVRALPAAVAPGTRTWASQFSWTTADAPLHALRKIDERARRRVAARFARAESTLPQSEGCVETYTCLTCRTGWELFHSDPYAYRAIPWKTQLLARARAATMRPMIRHRASRSLIALVTALLLLACQVAFAAEACANSIGRTSENTAAMPCHDAADERGSPAGQAPAVSGCEASKAVADPVKVPVFALADLRAVLVTYLQPIAVAAVTRALAPQAVCSSPPLTILHCRLLN
jgi:hypothetical protein